MPVFLLRFTYQRNSAPNRPLTFSMHFTTADTVPRSDELTAIGSSFSYLLTEDMKIIQCDVFSLIPAARKIARKVNGLAVLKTSWVLEPLVRLLSLPLNILGKHGLPAGVDATRMLMGLGALINLKDSSPIGKVGRMFLRGIGYEGDYGNTSANEYAVPTWISDTLNAMVNTATNPAFLGAYLRNNNNPANPRYITNAHIDTSKTDPTKYQINYSPVLSMVARRVKVYKGKKPVSA